MLKPLLILAGLTCAIMGMLCCSHTAATYYDAQGRPMGTWAGDMLKCEECIVAGRFGAMKWQNEHNYKCITCGKTCKIRHTVD